MLYIYIYMYTTQIIMGIYVKGTVKYSIPLNSFVRPE